MVPPFLIVWSPMIHLSLTKPVSGLKYVLLNFQFPNFLHHDF